MVIIGREFLISGLRSIASSEGFTIQASDLGKLKTVLQIVTVVSAILAHHWYQWQFGDAHHSRQVDRRRRHLFHGGWFPSSPPSTTLSGFWKQIDHASKDRRKTFVLTRRKSESTHSAH